MPRKRTAAALTTYWHRWPSVIARVGLVVYVLLALTAAPAEASTDEQRLAAHAHSAESSFPSACTGRITYILHADDIIRRTYPAAATVPFGMAADNTGRFATADGPVACTVYMRSGLSAPTFRYTLFHETAHTAGWQHSAAMDQAVSDAYNRTRS